jgi:hypothetical protein
MDSPPICDCDDGLFIDPEPLSPSAAAEPLTPPNVPLGLSFAAAAAAAGFEPETFPFPTFVSAVIDALSGAFDATPPPELAAAGADPPFAAE